MNVWHRQFSYLSLLHFICLFTLSLSFLLVSSFSAVAGPSATGKDAAFKYKPVDNKGKKWRIGYYEGGEYIDYQNNTIALIKGLKKLGWIDFDTIPEQKGEQTKDLWKWLSGGGVKSRYIEFLPNAHYSSRWDKEIRKMNAKTIINRLATKKDIDLIIAAGTWAGQDLVNNHHQTPTIVISTSDPVTSKIIKSVDDSGYDHVHARVDPFRFERQIRIFHDIMGFKKLGITYENTVSGRSIAAIDKAETIAKELGFDIVPCHVIDDIPDKKQAAKNVNDCYNTIIQKVDAIYVTILSGVNDDSLPGLVNLFNTKQVPTFSQYGSKFVKEGILMSISRIGFEYVGMFYAETIATMLNGVKPRDIGQVFEDPPKIAINLDTAITIGYDPPVDVLSAADEIFQGGGE